jgi:hypothetical protein
MAKKSVIAGEYILSVLDSGSIEVYRIYDNVKGALREIAEKEGFEYDPNWNRFSKQGWQFRLPY